MFEVILKEGLQYIAYGLSRAVCVGCMLSCSWTDVGLSQVFCLIQVGVTGLDQQAALVRSLVGKKRQIQECVRAMFGFSHSKKHLVKIPKKGKHVSLSRLDSLMQKIHQATVVHSQLDQLESFCFPWATPLGRVLLRPAQTSHCPSDDFGRPLSIFSRFMDFEQVSPYKPNYKSN